MTVPVPTTLTTIAITASQSHSEKHWTGNTSPWFGGPRLGQCCPRAFVPYLARMSSPTSPSSPSLLATQLADACDAGNFQAAKAAVDAGASVNDKRSAPGYLNPVCPLAAAAFNHSQAVVVWLLRHGADPNGDSVMSDGACYSTPAILQLLIDAGGDVNRNSGRMPPLFAATNYNHQENVQVLLAVPALDLAINCNGRTPEQYAREINKHHIAELFAEEVSPLLVTAQAPEIERPVSYRGTVQGRAKVSGIFHHHLPWCMCVVVLAGHSVCAGACVCECV